MKDTLWINALSIRNLSAYFLTLLLFFALPYRCSARTWTEKIEGANSVTTRFDLSDRQAGSMER